MGVHQDNSDVYYQIKMILGIPKDEPIFIIRAQDKFSVKIIRYYHDLVRDGVRNIPNKGFSEWLSNVESITNNFLNWQRDNRDKVKVPD